jgi:hypothetical protein
VIQSGASGAGYRAMQHHICGVALMAQELFATHVALLTGRYEACFPTVF